MNLEIATTKLDKVKLIRPPTIFEDFRGYYVETYNQDIYRQAGIDIEFKQDDISVSRQHTLRGIHGDQDTWKLVSCLQGTFYLLVVNNDPASAQYKQWQGFTLSETNRLQVLIPPKFGNGHLVLSEWATFHYKQNTNYNRAGQFTLFWNDPAFNFWWPLKEPLIISQRDDPRYAEPKTP
jgi:dTDP-4-dehydrorhamnose 3,5-epimerase